MKVQDKSLDNHKVEIKDLQITIKVAVNDLNLVIGKKQSIETTKDMKIVKIIKEEIVMQTGNLLQEKETEKILGME